MTGLDDTGQENKALVASVVHRNYWYFQRLPVVAMQGGVRREWLVLSKRPNAAVRPQVASLRASRKAVIRCVTHPWDRVTNPAGTCLAANRFASG